MPESSSRTGDPTVPLLRPQMPELDTLRGVAILVVLCYHGLFWSSAGVGAFHGLSKVIVAAFYGGWLGVNLFFILSGFLITGILLDSAKRENYYSRFYYRRALRIVPASYLMIGVWAIATAASKKTTLLAFAYLANMSAFFGAPILYAPLWSLAVEEHFYFLWPTAVRVFSRRTLTAICIGIIVGTPILRAIAFRTGHGLDVGTVTWYVADGLALGALVAIFARDVRASRANVCWAAGSLAAASALLGLVGLPFGITSKQRIVGAALQVVPWNLAFASLLLFTLLVGTSRWSRWVNIRWLQFLGYISYGLYLVHVAVWVGYDKIVASRLPQYSRNDDIGLLLVRFGVGAAVGIGLAYLSRISFEEFFLRQKNRLFRDRYMHIARVAAPAGSDT